MSWKPGQSWQDIEKAAIEDALDYHDGSTEKAAQALRLSIRTIQIKIIQYGIDRHKKEPGRPPTQLRLFKNCG